MLATALLASMPPLQLHQSLIQITLNSTTDRCAALPKLLLIKAHSCSLQHQELREILEAMRNVGLVHLSDVQITSVVNALTDSAVSNILSNHQILQLLWQKHSPFTYHHLMPEDML